MTTVTSNGAGSYLVLADNLLAGFLLSGRDNFRKKYAAFLLDGEHSKPVFKRECTGKEKKALKKEIFCRKTVRSVQRTTSIGEPCMLFVRK